LKKISRREWALAVCILRDAAFGTALVLSSIRSFFPRRNIFMRFARAGALGSDELLLLFNGWLCTAVELSASAENT